MPVVWASDSVDVVPLGSRCTLLASALTIVNEHPKRTVVLASSPSTCSPLLRLGHRTAARTCEFLPARMSFKLQTQNGDGYTCACTVNGYKEERRRHNNMQRGVSFPTSQRKKLAGLRSICISFHPVNKRPPATLMPKNNCIFSTVDCFECRLNEVTLFSKRQKRNSSR
jgi:hypothetical protein